MYLKAVDNDAALIGIKIFADSLIGKKVTINFNGDPPPPCGFSTNFNIESLAYQI